MLLLLLNALFYIIDIKYLPNQWIAIFARFDWLLQLGISLDIHCFVNGEKNGVSFCESFRGRNFFYPSDLVKFNTKTTIPLRVGEERWI